MLYENTEKQIKHGQTTKEPLLVTRPDLPPLEDFLPYLEKIWQRRWLTNSGQFHQELEARLADYLGVGYVSLFSNGTLALVSALQVLRISGEVITTPYSFVATTHALNWNGIQPVFCDVDPLTLNLDPSKVESLITPQTTAILPVHVYGNPADVEALEQLADVYGLKIIYDACHAFGVTYKGQSILNYGDLSVLSFHATKIFTTMEGGAIVTNDAKLKKRIDYIKNFGFADEVTVMAPGINGKMNEMQAALGVLQLEHMPRRITRRRALAGIYAKKLKNVHDVELLHRPDDVGHNWAYFPVFIAEEKRDIVYEVLKQHGIFTRRYFFPLISHFPIYRGLPSASPENLPVAERASRRVICLPFYPSLTDGDVEYICDTFISVLAHAAEPAMAHPEWI